MSLSLALDDAAATYRPGDAITGRLSVDVEGYGVRGTIALRLLWECHGRFLGQRGVLAAKTFEGGVGKAWTPGRQELEFSFEAVGEPWSYEGELFDVDWVLAAKAELDGQLSAEASIDVFSVPPQGVRPRFEVVDSPSASPGNRSGEEVAAAAVGRGLSRSWGYPGSDCSLVSWPLCSEGSPTPPRRRASSIGFRA